MKGIGKSIWKGVKYAGISLGAAAVGAAAQPDVVSAAIVGAITGVGAPAYVAVLAGQYAVPIVAAALAGTAQQLWKHRDKVLNPPEPEP